MHGVFDRGSSCNKMLSGTIAQLHPGTKFIVIDLFNDLASLDNPMTTQVKKVTEFVKSQVNQDPESFSDGFNMICHSQGGLICRGLISQWDGKPGQIKAFISLAGPQQGIFGYTGMIGKLPRSISKLLLPFQRAGGVVLYTYLMQKSFSVAGYWKDIGECDLYQEASKFLAIINNEAPAEPCGHEKWNPFSCEPSEKCRYSLENGCVWKSDFSLNRSIAMKTNFMSLESAVFLGSPDDGVLVPWDSSIWNYYAPGSGKSTVPFNKTFLGTQNLVPLSEMLQQGRAVLMAKDGVDHQGWMTNASTVNWYIDFLK